jgi:glycosyltransferase involved in cell wall biosynthesis
VVLPLHARNGVLLSLANAAPLALRRQCVTIHDASVFAVPQAYSPQFRTWYKLLLPALGRRAQRIVTDSEFSRTELARRAGVPLEKIRVIPPGADHILAIEPDRKVLERHGLDARPFVLAVGSRAPHKNLSGLDTAAMYLRPRDYDIVVAGGSDTRIFSPHLERSAKAIKHLGYVTDRELRALYEHAACFVYPSFYEGFGIPPLEAMMCKCPVIVSRVASLPEVCGDAALYCDPHDPVDIARSIDVVMRDPNLQAALTRSGFERAGAFTWDRTACGLAALLDELIDR